MSLLSKAKVNESAAAARDTVGGFTPMPSDIHTMDIEFAFVEESATTGSIAVTLMLANADHSLKSIQYIVSRKDKGNTNTYTNKDGDVFHLPGFVVVNDITLLTTGKELSELETAKKQVMLFSWDEQKEVSMEKEVITELTGKRIAIGTILKLEDNYNNPTKQRSIPEIDKVFEADTLLTVTEKDSGEAKGIFHNNWLKTNKGKVVDERKLSLPGGSSGEQADNPFDSSDAKETATESDNPFAKT